MTMYTQAQSLHRWHIGCWLSGALSAMALFFLWSSPAPAYQQVEVDNGGTIVGRVSVTGEVSDQQPFEVFKHKEG